MSKVSFVGASADEKDMLLGPEFRSIDVIDFEVVEGGAIFTRVILQSRVITLTGEPRKALRNWLGCAEQIERLATA
jgi:hypothetical protein